ncbi:S1-C subfamily serine protease [Amycolatopsis sulphurea]|uniref:S1-C subfamily serine protease n=1 Tax=Amycolatopsis sulphurea TaxID=76022 RepID=A0A2A9FGD1_9PSEU|nr:trypsin-like peptidase domain-containing protein [Amycolatopsis sulphurea]PFG49826.1 S1-C subfamily serine protease [Amycolatopsis sulphurea]
MSENPNAPLGAPWPRPQQVAPPAPAPESAPQPTPPPSPQRRWRIVALVAGLVVLLGLTGFTITRYVLRQPPPPKPPSQPFDIGGAYARVRPGVANVEAVLATGQGVASGTGIVLGADGLVLTNNHVVEGSIVVRVTLAGGRVHDAKVLGYDRSHDLAVLKLAGVSGLPTATLGDSGQVKPGDYVLGVGNAGGQGGEPASAVGRVTALGRSIVARDAETGATETLHDLIQTDAPVRQGDSGGPLTDTAGRVIGVNVAGSAGYAVEKGEHESYTIPITPAAEIAGQIAAGKESGSIHIGPSAYLGMTVNETADGAGAMIQALVQKGPADEAGLKAGLLVVGVGDQPVRSAADLIAQMDRHHPGETLKFTITGQGGQQATVSVQAASGPIG